MLRPSPLAFRGYKSEGLTALVRWQHSGIILDWWSTIAYSSGSVAFLDHLAKHVVLTLDLVHNHTFAGIVILFFL